VAGAGIVSLTMLSQLYGSCKVPFFFLLHLLLWVFFGKNQVNAGSHLAAFLVKTKSFYQVFVKTKTKTKSFVFVLVCFEIGSHYMAHVGLKLSGLLPQPSAC
jgi:hypothetical protein